MSKFLPMFKKKGKGKEEDVNEETKKKRGKISKSPKEVILGPSGAVSKPEKKRKSAKRKAPTPHGKENYPSVQELEKEFFIDDAGVVRECPTELYIDASGAVKEGPREQFISNALSLEDSVSESISETSCDKGLAEDSRSDSLLSVDDMKESTNTAVDKTHECLPPESEVTHSDSAVATSHDEAVTKDTEGFPENLPSQEIVTCEAGSYATELTSNILGEESQGATSSDSDRLNESAVSVGGECTSGYIQPGEAQHFQAEEMGAMNNLSVSDVSEETAREARELNEVPEYVYETDMNDSTCPIISEPDIGDDFVTVRTEGNYELETGSKEERAAHLTHDDSSVEDQTSLSNTLDSEDDYGSAQEDWDEEDTEEKILQSKPKLNKCKLLKQDEFEAPRICQDEVIEAINESMDKLQVKPERQCTRDTSSTSSVYQDAPSIGDDSEIHNINSIVDATNDDLNATIRSLDSSSPLPKLTRKFSSVSASSSDVFNEELDDLLNEELDRLSEEETGTIPSLQNFQGENSPAVPTVSVADSISLPEQHEALTEGNESGIPQSEINEDEVIEEQCNSATEHIDCQGTDVVSRTSESKEPEDCSVSSQENKSLENNIAEESVPCPILQPAEETLDQAKDSGYYSLPVSPKPNTATVREREPVAAVTCVADDSFGDSEEEGMVTPPTEMTVIPLKSEVVEVRNPLIEDSVVDSYVVTEPTGPTEICCATEKTEGDPILNTIDELPTSVEEDKKEGSEELQKVECPKDKREGSEELQKFECPKQDASQATTTEVKESTASTRSGSTTPSRHSRHKSPGLSTEIKHNGDEGMRSPDPIGDMFLQQAVNLSHEEAEARLAQRRAARAEARELRLRELEKQQHDQENEEEKQFASPSYTEPLPRVGLGRAVGRTASMNCTGQYSRRSSEDSTSDETLPANVREMRAELKELDEKFRKAMITNAQLDNEKATLTYEVELMKDRYTELEEAHTQLTKEHRRKCTEYEQLKKVSTKLQEEVKLLRSMLQERDQLIQEYGLVVVGEEENGEDGDHVEEEDEDVDDLSPRKISVKKVLVSQEAAELLCKGAAQGSLDVRLKKFGEERNELEDQVRRLKLELEEERNKNRRRENGLDYEKQKEQSKTVNEYKFRVQKAEAEVSTLQANVVRLDALSTRYRTQSEELERSEEELKSEKRKLQRELRDAQSRLEELETTNNHLVKRFDKLKNARSNLLKDLSQDPA